MDFFNPESRFKVVYVDGGETDGGMMPNRSRLTEAIKPRVMKGQDYVKTNISEDTDEKDFELLKKESKKGVSDLDETTIGTMVDVCELQENMAKIKMSYYGTEKPKTDLIINQYKKKILSLIETNEVVVLTGPTGCGKTTQVPQFLLDSCVEKNKFCNIVVTQPRRLAAISVAKRVSEERGWPLGKLCGFKVGLKDCTSEETHLTYMTVGVLLQTLIKRRNLNNYTHIILDEVHERDQSMDFVLIVIKKFLSRAASNTKVILMSATVEAMKFAKYFQKQCLDEFLCAPVINISHSTNYAVEVHYLDELSALGDLPEISLADPRISEAAFDICVRLIKQFEKIDVETEQKNSVLIFLPGIHEIEYLHMKLTDPKIYSSGGYKYKWCVLPLHSSITVEEQAQVFLPSQTGYRKIIISTNIAESSITVPGVKFVIDFCVTKRLKTDPSSNFTSLQLCWASQANCVQRAGRVGRVMEGRVYRMVPREFYEGLQKQSVPEMLDSPLERVVLQSKMLDMGEPRAILAQALDPPDLTNIECTILILKEAGGLLRTRNGVLTPLDGDLTYLGRLMATLPVDFRVTRLMVMGHFFSCLHECIIIGACMSLKNVFSNPFRGRLDAYNSKLNWADGSCSDCLAFLNVYQVWCNNHDTGYFRRSVGDNERTWAKRHFLQLRVLKEIKVLADELRQRLKDNSIEESAGIGKVLWSDFQKALVLKIAIAGAFYPNYFGRGVRYGLSDEENAVRILGGRNPFTTVILHGFPPDQPMQLYSQLIKNELLDCGEEMRLSSNNCSKIYVEFRQHGFKSENSGDLPFDGRVPGRIPVAVYRAIKTRQIKRTINIKVLPAHEARKRAELLGIKNEDVIVNKENNIENPKVLPCSLPGVDISSIRIVISHVIDPGHFWAYNVDSLNNQKMIFRALNNDACNYKPLDKIPSVGDICIAPYEECGETRFYRARVESVKRGKVPIVEIFFIDYGNYEILTLGRLKEYGPEMIQLLSKIPAQAFECVLSEVRPSLIRNSKAEWSERARVAFEKVIQGGELIGYIYSVVNGVVSMDLHKIDRIKNQMSINQFLLAERYAEKVEENYLSRLNHAVRKETQLNCEQKRVYNDMQREESWSDGTIKPPAVEDLKVNVQMRGPTSPLEMTLYPYTRGSLGKSVFIAEESVNSVLLNTDPEDTHEKLVVAANVCQNSIGSKLILSNTTVMPNIHGIASLIPFIFAPEIELRVNRERTKYTGILCGLGVDEDGEPIFPEHDMEIPFDCEISYEDFTDVNTLRYYMSLLLMTEDNEPYPCLSNMDIIKYQRKIKNYLLRLFNRERNSVEVEVVNGRHEWGKTPADIVVTSPLAINFNQTSIFRFHPGVSLATDVENKDRLP